MAKNLRLFDINVPSYFNGNNSNYYPDGIFFGYFNKKAFCDSCRIHDYLYSKLSDEDYPDIDKEKADIMLKNHLEQLGYSSHASGYYSCLQNVGHLFYKKTPQGDPRKTHDFEKIMNNIDQRTKLKYRIIDSSIIICTTGIGLFLLTKYFVQRK